METNAKLRYEALILAVPEITADESSMLESQFQDVVSKNKGDMLSFERWGKYRLAYEVRKNEYGVYYLTRFEVPSEQKSSEILEKLRQFFAVKHNEIIMRHMFARLDENGSLEYKRPESLEEAPRRDVGTFLKENKMTSLMKEGKSARSDSAFEDFEEDDAEVSHDHEDDSDQASE